MMELMEFLLKNRENRGVLATLRCALVENREMRAWPLLAVLGGIGDTPGARSVRTVAGLFASHPENCTEGNMGSVCRALCTGDEKPWNVTDGQGESVQPGPMARKFMYLLNADPDEIHARVRRLVLYAKTQGIPVNYAGLEKDLRSWPRPREAWARSFFAPEKREEHSEQGGTAS